MSTSPSDKKMKKTLALCMIVKNEEQNMPALFESIRGCFDEIHITDTGSTDKTVEWLESQGSFIAGCPVRVHHFAWVDSFAQARNFSFSHATTDYVAWIDGDDRLNGREGFLAWKHTCMEHADVFLNTYNYALDPDGKPVVSFLRERVFKRSTNPKWQYDIHEGIVLDQAAKVDYALSWSIDHHRTVEDVKADRSRNITIIEKIKAAKGLDSRLQFYYGKELFEINRVHESLPEFDKAIASSDLQPHDRLLSYQYASYACQMLGDQIKDELKEEKNKWYLRAIGYCMDGLKSDGTRAEFYVSAADSYLKCGDLARALPLYAAAKNCITAQTQGSKIAQPIYSFKNCYGELPSLQMAKINFNMGRIEEAITEAEFCVTKFKNEEARAILEQLKNVRGLTTLDNNQSDTEDIVFSCPPNQAYLFDEEMYKTKPLGGSETALVQMARLLKKKTGRTVKVFNSREDDLIAESGVEYISNKKLNEYMSKHKPKAHVAWRHNVRVTNAPTYLWCHDLYTPTTETVHNFDKFMCLSEFHKEFTLGKQGIPSDKIWVTRNGIDPKKFSFERKPKDPNKFVYVSSPDRGLEQVIPIMELVRKELPEARLEIYYGWSHLYKYGPQMSELADRLQKMVEERPWIISHGFVEQNKMYEEISDAVVWLHSASFIETFCISALECLANGIYPVTRKLGALANTLEPAERAGHATLLDHGGITPEEKQEYADAAISAVKEKKWERVHLDLDSVSWNAVSDEWIKEMQL